jgi:predicted RNase H-like nuclease
LILRVIKGGRRYIDNCKRRLKRYEKIYNKNKSQEVNNRMIVLKKRIATAEKIYQSDHVQKMRKKITARKVIDKNSIRLIKKAVDKKV